jgi:hypothetical protein
VILEGLQHCLNIKYFRVGNERVGFFLMVVVAIRLERICRDSESQGSYKGMLRKVNFSYIQNIFS